jgi:hypothetical protein
VGGAGGGSILKPLSDYGIKRLDKKALEFLKSKAFERFIVVESPFE